MNGNRFVDDPVVLVHHEKNAVADSETCPDRCSRCAEVADTAKRIEDVLNSIYLELSDLKSKLDRALDDRY